MLNFLFGVKDDFPRENLKTHGLVGSSGSKVLNIDRFQFSFLRPPSGVLELWAALEIGCGPKPYPSPPRGAQRQIPLITKTPNWAPDWKDSCPGRFWVEFRGYGGALGCYMEEYFGGFLGLEGVWSVPRGAAEGSCGGERRKRDSRCLQTGLRPCQSIL